MISHHGLFYKLRSIAVGRQILYIVSKFLSDRPQSVRLDGMVSASVDVVSRVPQDSVIGSLFFILYMQIFQTDFASSSDGIADSRFGNNLFTLGV